MSERINESAGRLEADALDQAIDVLWGYTSSAAEIKALWHVERHIAAAQAENERLRARIAAADALAEAVDWITTETFTHEQENCITLDDWFRRIKRLQDGLVAYRAARQHPDPEPAT